VPSIDVTFAEFASEPPDAPRLYYAMVSWLESLATDLARISSGPGRGESGQGG
jgi:hypothetical protein